MAANYDSQPSTFLRRRRHLPLKVLVTGALIAATSRCAQTFQLFALLGNPQTARRGRTTRFAYEVAPSWALDSAEEVKPRERIDAKVKIDHEDEEAAIASAREEILRNMKIEEKEVAEARIQRGEMHFEDFLCISMSMRYDIKDFKVPNGYEKIITAMTLEERTSPWLFKLDEPTSDERIARITEASKLSQPVVSVFLRDFGSLQAFFARVAGGTARKQIAGEMVKETAKIGAEKLADKTRRTRRHLESKSTALREAGKELRAKKSAERGFR
eukprot:TRINITY_DN3757_c0_g1_i2.p1 TRINITY_DN3757_c0_g1~~TRINITY_DN3757_c0_g1_i2.p1  ORF type:complete len:272 (+),score=48.10 TRINITY_DN3757_c0_g1_i2:103-918(+)